MAFFDLSTCRAFSESGPGPIPWTAVVEYADRAKLEPDVTAGFVRVIRAMDATYQKWYVKEAEKQRKSVEKKGKA